MKAPRPPLLVAIVGGSGSGKTWLARRLEKLLAPGAVRFSQDDFYRDLTHLTMAQRVRVNFDHPHAIEWAALEAVLRDFRAGRPTPLPRYDFATHCRLPNSRMLRPRPVVLVDGLWLLRRPAIRRLFSWRIFIQCPSLLRLERRILRDTTERGRTRHSVVEQFRRHVAPMHDRFVEPQARWADCELESPVSPRAARQIAGELRKLAKK